ncbi:hypothetical protein KUTeg_006847 [Tegillarca granosa]|uniref:Centrosomal protein of 290kDa coiled-coil region domain-containing protein n=1 Tax=Tegillarca granosa TaxID=220873 RepID=A0ABQ9FFR0_TEGGR|nr:hypothetical protein KUTeg_006847 [Tegillarca granosa]
MPPLEWDKVMAATPAKLSDDDVEEFYESLVSYDPTPESDAAKLQKLFEVAKAVMKNKNESVEDMMNEFEKEAKESKKKEEALLSEQDKLKKKIAELEYSERISELEKELKELRDDNDQLRQDLSDYKLQVQAHRETFVSSRGEDAEYREKLARKNHELAEAMEELQNLTDANDEYQKKIDDMNAQLQDAINNMDRITEDYMKLQSVLQKSDAVTDKLKEENEILKAQVIDLNEQVQSKTDADDAIMVAVNNKIEEWKEIIQEKDANIMELQDREFRMREQLIAANMDSDKASVAALSKVVKEKDKQIEELTEQIKNYVDEMEANAAVIDDLRAELQKTGTGPGDRQHQKIKELQNEVKYQKQKCEDIEKELKSASHDAREKDKDLTNALERMQQYESFALYLVIFVFTLFLFVLIENKNVVTICPQGEYGLAEAVAEIKDCRNQIKVRDRQIEELTQHINKAEMKINDIEEENEDLRYRLGMDPKEPLDLTEFRKNKKLRKEEEKALNFILQKEVEKLEDERIELKRKIRKLAQQTGQRAVALGLTAEDMMAVQDFQEEIKATRAQTSQTQKGVSIATRIKREVEEEEAGLRHREYDQDFKENLREMDKLYRENAELKVKVKHFEEDNNQLEQGLKEVLENMKKYSPDEKDAEQGLMQFPTLERMLAIEKMEAELKESKDMGGGPGLFQAMPLPQAMAVTSSEVISNLNEHLIITLQEISLKEESMKKMETSLENYKRKFAVMRHQQGLLYQDYLKDKNEWETEMKTVKEKLHELEGMREEDKVRIQEFDRLLESLSKDDTEVRRRLSEMTRRITVLRVNEKALTRRYQTMEEMDGSMRKEVNRYKNEIAAIETAVAERMGYLQRFKDMATYKIGVLQKTLDDSVPNNDLEMVNRKYHELTEKYRDTLEKENTLVTKAEAITGLEGEVKRLTEENDVYRKTLLIEKEKLHSLEAAVEELHKRDSDVITVSKKITTLEMKELNERQRAEHAVRMYEQQRAILQDVETRNKDLEEKFSEITKSNLELQKIERELRDELANSVTKAVSDADRKRIQDLEGLEITLRHEISKLKEVCEVAGTQVKTLEMQQLSKEKEFQSLRQQLLDFQVQSDEKTIIGKLHRHIVQLQVSEGTAVKRLTETQKKVTKLEAMVLRLEQRLDDKDQTLYHNRTEAQNKAKHLKRNLQELRIQFAGAVPLSRQEKFSKAMMQLQQNKNKLELELRKVTDDRFEVEEKLAEVELQRNSLQELIETLKDGRGAAKVMEWRGKMDAIRLEELKQKRLNAKLHRQITYLEGNVQAHEVTIADLEADNVRLLKDYEDRQLRWEQRELELERTIANMEQQAAQIAGAASQFEAALGALPDAKLPLSKQLEQAVTTIKVNVKTILDTQAESKILKERNKELEKQLRDAEHTIIARDKLVSELRLRMPATADRDEIIIKATTSVTQAMQQKVVDKNFESEHSIKIAQSTISSLQQRIQQKEETIAKYQELLNQARADMQEMNRRHEQDLKNMQQKIHMNTDAAFNKFKEAAQELMAKQSIQPASSKQLKRLSELEDTVAEQDNAMAAMSEKIKQREEEITSLKIKLQEHSREYSLERERMIDEMKEELEKKEREIEDYQRQSEHMKKEIELLTEEVATLKEHNTRAPTTTMKNLVERLKNQLALKEKQHQALSKALTELRADMVQQAQEHVKYHSEESSQEANIQKIIDKHTKEMVDQIDELQTQVERQKKEIKKRKDQQNTLQTEIDDLREEMGRLNAYSSMPKKSSDDHKQHELEEMRRRVRMLEDELKRKQQVAEKPYERVKEQPKESPKEKSDEVIKWEERKKWQKTVEKMKLTIQEKEQDVEKYQRANKMMKDQLDRAIRDKDTLEKTVTRLQRQGAGPVAPPSGPSEKPDHKVEELKTKNYQLQEEVANLRRQLTLGKEAAFTEVQLRNQHLSEQLEQMEKVVSKQVSATSMERGSGGGPSVGVKEYQEVFEKNQELQRQMLKLSEENIELKFEAEQARKDIPRLKIGESGKSTRELEKTIALLKKVVERVQNENEQLKKTPSIATHDQVQSLKVENSGLKSQLEELRHKMGASLSERYTSAQKGTAKMMNDYESMRKDLMKEVETNEKLRIKISNLEVHKEQLESQLHDHKSKTEFGRPSMEAMDSKGWKSVVATRMYEGKVKDLESEIEKKNKLLGDTKTLLKEAAEREQLLIIERDEMRQKMAILERFPASGPVGTSSEMVRDYQQSRLIIERLENEKKQLLYELDLGDEIMAKATAYDRLMDENVEVKMELKSVTLDRDKLNLEVQRLKKELKNFGPDFFEEIEDLKYNYKQILERNLLYEEKLQQLSRQFGVPVDIPGLP